MPLHEHEAKRIISCATLAPFGHGERTIVDKDVRDTWEIDPSRLSFTHPQWEMFIRNTVCAQVCESLGVSGGDSPPKMELYKLLLYEEGSQYVVFMFRLFEGAKAFGFSLVFYPIKSWSLRSSDVAMH